jgi:glycine/D-amino acid oxidase-like deaminating enzyme
LASPALTKDRYEAIVVGSGFGGAVAACRLAQAGVDLAVLARRRRFDCQGRIGDPAGGADGFAGVGLVARTPLAGTLGAGLSRPVP